MMIALHIFKLIALAAMGYASVFLVMFVALQFGIIAALPADEYLYNFRLAYFGGGMMAALAGTGLGVLSLFTRGRLSAWLLWLPLLVPALYSMAVLTYFSALPTPAL